MIRFYLLFSAILVFLIALGYGVAPEFVLPLFLDLSFEGKDLTPIFRALMGMYLAFVALWVAGAYLPCLTLPAIIAETVFMAGLALGRLLSVFNEGWPSPILTIGGILEVVFAIWGGCLWFCLQRHLHQRNRYPGIRDTVS